MTSEAGGSLGVTAAADMRDLVDAHDWAATSLGPSTSWPQGLRAASDIMLGSRFAMWMGWGPELAFLYNDAYAPTLGVKHGWALGRPLREVWAEIWPDIGPRIGQVMATGQATWDEALLLLLERRGYREETYHTFSYSPLRDDRGVIAGNFCVVTEETERVISERRLGTLRELSAALAEAASEAEAIAAIPRSLERNPQDLPFSLLYLWEEATGPARLVAHTGFGPEHAGVLERITRDGAAALWPTAAICAADSRVRITDLDRRVPGLPSGAWREPPDQAIAIAIGRQGEDQPAGFLVAGLNPHRSLDEPYLDFLRLIAGQIASAVANARAYQAERRRSAALAELDRAKTAFFSNVSHEFRTPLTLMLGPLQDALEIAATASGAELIPLLEIGNRNALRLLRLVNTLLDFSRIEAERVQAQYQPTDLARLTTDLASAFHSAMQRARLRFVIDCPALAEPVFVDPDMWEKIVLNLVSNAFKFTFAGEVRVDMAAEPGAVVLAVRDTGIGIPSEHLARIFERFHRIEGSQGRSHEGSGIGLALVRDLVALHGGEITVQSEPNVGSVFRVRIPFGTAHLPSKQIGAAPMTDRLLPAPPIREPALRRGTAFVQEALTWLEDAGRSAIAAFADPPDGPHAPARIESAGVGAAQILLADDNADMRDYMRRLLEADGHQVETVVDGEAALERLRQRRPDLMLTDVMMPRLDGLGLLRAVRADPALRDIPVILLSARAGEEAQVEGLQTLPDDYLTKPFSARELLARVNANLGISRLRRQALEEQRELSDRLRESEARFRMVGDTAPVLIWMSDETRAFVWFNQPWLEFTGRAMEQELGQGWTEALHPDDLDRCVATYQAHFGRQEPFRMDYRLRRHDGAWRVHDATGVPRFGGDGRFLGYIGSLVDVTDAREAAAALQRLNETLETRVAERTAERDRLWQVSEDLLVAAGYDGTLLRVSPSWTRLLGHTEADLLAGSIDRILHADDVTVAHQELDRMRHTGQPARIETRLRSIDGSFRWMAWALVPDANGTGLFGIGRDVTAEKAARDALLSQIEERERIEATLLQMQRLEAVGQLTSGVAHDFNNLLTVILGNVDYVTRGISDANLQRRLGMVRTAARRGATLTGQLLAFSRKQHLDPRPLDLNEVLGGMADLLRSTLGGTARLEIVLQPGLWPALADQTQLELVILNLAINARDAMPVGGALTIETGNATLGMPRRVEEPPPGDYVMVAVTDSGTGMPAEVLERVFEPFFTTKEPGKGSGLGLPQVYGFAQQSGGGVSIDTNLGEGTAVRVYLPRAAAMAPAPAPLPASPPPLPRLDAAAAHHRRVLLVDDDRAVRATTRGMLEDMGFQITKAGSGRAALDVLEGPGRDRGPEAAFDLMLIDFAMPGMNGLELGRQVERQYPDLAIVLITGYADTRALREAGNWPILAKPFVSEQLATVLQEVLAARTSPAATGPAATGPAASGPAASGARVALREEAVPGSYPEAANSSGERPKLAPGAAR